MKILITGGSGLLGQYLNEILSNNYDILSLYNTNPGNCKNFFSKSVDLTEFKSVDELFESFKPNVVVHTAAVSNPKLAGKLPPAKVYEINVKATGHLAKLCASYNCKLIYLSTDLVYDGSEGGNLKENSKLNPVSLYAETKLMGELKISGLFDNYLILRTALMYGIGLNSSKNHFTEVFEKLSKREPVKLFYDQFRSPLALHDAARMISGLIPLGIKGEIINFGGGERMSRFDLISELCKSAGFNQSLLIPVSMNDVNINYKVKDVSMNIEKLRSYGIAPMNIEDSIREVLKPHIN